MIFRSHLSTPRRASVRGGRRWIRAAAALRPGRRAVPAMMFVLGLTVMTPATRAAGADSANKPAADAHASAIAGIVRLVEIPGAMTAAVNDKLGLLVVGHANDDDAAVLSVLRLDEHGEVVKADGKPETNVVSLPRPESLADHPSYPLALTFNPKLPVLYVWQDIAHELNEKDKGYKTVRDRIYAQFHHLVIFKANKKGLSKVAAECGGDAYMFRRNHAALAVSRDGKRLFIPNLYGPPGDEGSDPGALGYFDLDDAGRLVPVPVPIAGTLDGAGVQRFEMRIKPRTIYVGFGRYGANGTWRYMNPGTVWPAFAPNKRVVLFGTSSGIGVWDTEDRRQALSEVNIRYVGRNSGFYLANDPSRSLIYAADRRGNIIVRMAYVDGFPTLMPHMTTIPEAVHAGFRSPPVVIDGQAHGLAIVGRDVRANRWIIYLIELDDKGRITGDVKTIKIHDTKNPRPVLAYSSKYDRLYVVLSKKPKDKSDKESSP